MKLFLSFILILSMNAESSTYMLVDEWHRANFNQRLSNVVEENIILDKKEQFHLALNSGYAIRKNLIYRYFDGRLLEKVGSIKECDSFRMQCLELDGFLYLRLPSDFNFHNRQKWKWRDIKYEAQVKQKYNLLGHKMEIVIISVRCESCVFKLVNLHLDDKRGIIKMKFIDKDVMLTYMLNEEAGYLSNSKPVIAPTPTPKSSPKFSPWTPKATSPAAKAQQGKSPAKVFIPSPD